MKRGSQATGGNAPKKRKLSDSKPITRSQSKRDSQPGGASHQDKSKALDKGKEKISGKSGNSTGGNLGNGKPPPGEEQIDSSSASGEDQEETTIQYAGMDGQQRKSSVVLQEASDRRVVIVQFGGSTGNTAGDAAIIALKDSRRRAVVDVGVGTKPATQSGALFKELNARRKNDPENSDESEGEEASENESGNESEGESESESEPNPKQLLVITHWHEDHAGKPVRWGDDAAQLPTVLGTKNTKDPAPKLLHGQRPPTKNYKAAAENMSPTPVLKNGAKLFAWRSAPGKNKRDGHTGLRVEGRAIVPPQTALKDAAQNEESLGVLVFVNKYPDGSDDAPERLFTMVSLGDMAGTTVANRAKVAAQVHEVREKFASGKSIDVVKLAHHGSNDNLAVVPEGLIGGNTTVIISGYTGKDSVALRRKIAEWKPKHVIMAAQSPDTLTALNDLGVAWSDLKQEANVIAANNVVMTMDDDGDVVIEATAFD